MQHSPLLSFWKLSSILALTSRSYGEKAPASFTDHIGNVRGSSQGRAAAAQRDVRSFHPGTWPPMSCTSVSYNTVKVVL